jgi:hypothetical protein
MRAVRWHTWKGVVCEHGVLFISLNRPVKSDDRVITGRKSQLRAGQISPRQWDANAGCLFHTLLKQNTVEIAF